MGFLRVEVMEDGVECGEADAPSSLVHPGRRIRWSVRRDGCGVRRLGFDFTPCTCTPVLQASSFRLQNLDSQRWNIVVFIFQDWK